ncbi:MAG: hypothetical protein AAGA58_09375 [Verrucomicrobiota bacterium]
MFRNISLLYSVLLLSFAILEQVQAQGPLTPPGAPGPTMKSLDQVEPRTDVASLPPSSISKHAITQPGSYYLTGDLVAAAGQGAISIDSSLVTLDLNGYTISSAGNNGIGVAIAIFTTGQENITIKNGHIAGGGTRSGSSVTGGGFLSGIDIVAVVPNLDPTNILVDQINASGFELDGIDVESASPSSLVTNCIVKTVGQTGISAGEVRDCVAQDCGSDGIAAFGNVVNCRGKSFGSLVSTMGIRAGANVTNSTGIVDNLGEHGINAGANVSNSFGISSRGHGIYAEGNVENSTGKSTGTNGAGSSDGVHSLRTVRGSDGEASTGNGVFGTRVVDCTGSGSGSGNGINATGTISGCRGIANGSGNGINSTTSVSDSYGSSSSGIGIRCTTVQNSFASTSTGAQGLFAFGTAANCRGDHGNSGIAIQATIASACTAVGGKTITATTKVDGTP